ncbi:MAG: DHH family phosphoesterase [bacterium]
MQKTSKKIHEHLDKAKQVLLVCHQNPDGDAIGSISVMIEYLKKLNKQFRAFCVSEVPDNLKFIPHAHVVDNNHSLFVEKNTDTIIVLDSGDMRYAGIDKLVENHQATIINIDHHPTNENYGHFNLVDNQSSSTTEVLYNYMRYNGIRLNRNLATAILTGIITDTGNFTNSATSISAMSASGQLLRAGANLDLINKWTVKNTSFNALKLWGVALKRLEHRQEQDLVYTYLTKKDCDDLKINEEQADGIANFMNSIVGVKIGLFMKEMGNNQVKGSLRTVHNNVDVSAMAKKLGGGGHKKAAGFTIEGTIKEVLNKILTIKQ